MPNYRRAFVPGGRWFFTANLLDRRSSLLIDEIETLREATRRTRERHPFRIDAFVVLPDHIHAIWTLPEGDTDFSTRWRLIKIVFSKAIPTTERPSKVRRARGERGIWQRRFWEHPIRDDEDYRRHVEYCYINSRETRACFPRRRLAVLVVSPRRVGWIVFPGLGGRVRRGRRIRRGIEWRNQSDCALQP